MIQWFFVLFIYFIFFGCFSFDQSETPSICLVLTLRASLCSLESTIWTEMAKQAFLVQWFDINSVNLHEFNIRHADGQNMLRTVLAPIRKHFLEKLFHEATVKKKSWRKTHKSCKLYKHAPRVLLFWLDPSARKLNLTSRSLLVPAFFDRYSQSSVCPSACGRDKQCP